MKTSSEAVGPAQIPAFGTKMSGFSGGRTIINTGHERQELPPLPGGTIGKNQKGGHRTSRKLSYPFSRGGQVSGFRQVRSTFKVIISVRAVQHLVLHTVQPLLTRVVWKGLWYVTIMHQVDFHGLLVLMREGLAHRMVTSQADFCNVPTSASTTAVVITQGL
ncbi:hypothetical protein MRX96_023951 [Rhipicephalus microplus]